MNMTKLHRIVRTVDGQEAVLGYTFCCPGCKGHHAIFTNAQASKAGTHWEFNGSMERPTFAPSVRVRWTENSEDKTCHFHIRDGMIDFCADSTHDLAGKTVPLEDFQ